VTELRDRELPDFAAEGLLDGLDERQRAARLTLLRRLSRAGVSLDELKRAVAEGRLALLPVERVLEAEGRYTLQEIAEMSGVDADLLADLRRATGLTVPEPESRVYTERDLESAKVTRQFLDTGIPREMVIETGRAFGQAGMRAAAAVRETGRRVLARPGDSELDLALRLAAVARALIPATAQQLGRAYESHFQQQLRGDVLEQGAIASGMLEDARDVAIGFADLVGFTRLGEALPPEDLGALASRLEEMTIELIEPPVRLVKTIGDAVMVAGPEPGPVIEAMVDLVDAAEAEGEGFPELRAGVAFGRAMRRWDDFYGPPVNLASRIVGVARPGSVLTTREIRDQLKDEFRWSRVAPKKVKGIKEPLRLVRVRRLKPAEPTGD
jgi:adenylate cyclase